MLSQINFVKWNIKNLDLLIDYIGKAALGCRVVGCPEVAGSLRLVLLYGQHTSGRHDEQA
jgi:hypothetical protein